MQHKKGQIALFVIIAIMLVGGILLVYSFFQSPSYVPSKLAPAESQLQGCIKTAVEQGTALMGAQGGYITPPKFEAGSEIYPSTSQLNFFGAIVPHWFYISGNGIANRQDPSLDLMNLQLGDYIKSSLKQCSFKNLEDSGFTVSEEGEPKVTADIKDGYISANVVWPVTITLGNTTRRITSHNLRVSSNFKGLYDTAESIFKKENSGFFLEQYALDIISLNAPTTDVAISCAPKIWSKIKIIGDIENSLAANIPAIKFSGNYYTLNQPEEKYFVQVLDKPVVNGQVNIIYDSNMPTAVEIDPSDGDIMRADPIGMQEGLGALGFCYVPYHFVYSMNFPVLIQVFDSSSNFFQFSTVVVVKNSHTRNETVAEQPEDLTNSPICQYKNQAFEVRTVDKYSNPVDADISLKCASAFCSIGTAEGGVLDANFPQCVNGFIVAQKEGYVPAKSQVSTDVEGSVEIPMKKLYTLNLTILGGTSALKGNDSAMVTFQSSDYSTIAYYPLQTSVDLAEGDYSVSGYVFKEGNITLAAQTTQKCVDVPQSGILGFFGFKTENCFNIDTPAQQLSQITVGGGNSQISLEDAQLKAARGVTVLMPVQPMPKTTADLQNIYTATEVSEVGLEFK